MEISLIKVRDWYVRYERRLASVALISGFAFNIVTLKRVDLFWENLWMASHFIFIAIFIILVNLQENEPTEHEDASKKHFWYLAILQFLFGGQLSTFIVFYFQSTTLTATWPFLLALSAALYANETLRKHYTRVTFQITLFYVSLLAFAIFIVPVILHRIGPDVFLISGLASLVVLMFFIFTVSRFAKEKFRQSKRILIYSISGIFLTTNILYFLNLIPPIPLSLKEGGVYHSLYRDRSGNYVVEAEEKGSFGFFSLHEDFHIEKGKPVYAYSAIFSPPLFNTEIVHVWQRYDERSRAWITMNRVNLPTKGGREGGFRTYSFMNNASPGEWRVNVETLDSKIISRLRFDVIQTDTTPNLVSKILY